jgi:hypothetical protein
MKKSLLSLVAGLLLGATVIVGAQGSGPYSAQIQRALASFLTTTHTWTAAQTFTGGVVLSGSSSNEDVTCWSSTTKDSYITEVGANNPGAYTNGTNCATGTLRFDWNATRILFASGYLVGIGSGTTPASVLDVTKTGAGVQDTLYLTNGQTAAAGVGSQLNFNGSGNIRSAALVGSWTGAATTDGQLIFQTRQANAMTTQWTINNNASSTLAPFTFANIATALAAYGNGTIGYCSDCTIANPCAGSGNGAIAKRLNGVNVCN